MVLDVYGASDKGQVRDLNEDSFCLHGFEDGQPLGFCVLSDGMGGHNAGEIASQRTVQFVAEELLKDAELREAPKMLSRAAEYANRKVYEMAILNQGQRGMGATLIAAAVCPEAVYIANVGDSRAYVMRDSELMQVTKDHSVVEEMVTNGTITPEEARNHPQRNIITRAIGADSRTEADIFEYEYYAGDVLLLCSDGLSSMLTDQEIQQILKESVDAKTVVTELIASANARGGRDNITVIAIRFI